MAERTCSIDGCDRPTIARGWCTKHYQRWRKYGDPLDRQFARGDVIARLVDKIEIVESGCWLWTGFILKSGYGQFWMDGTNRLAHRCSYELFVGPIPAGLEVDHDPCDTPACVNPEHLKPATPRANTLRGASLAAVNARKTHCPQGHAYDEANTQITPKGKRNCRACRRERARKERSRRAAK